MQMKLSDVQVDEFRKLRAKPNMMIAPPEATPSTGIRFTKHLGKARRAHPQFASYP